jgi:zinc protease
MTARRRLVIGVLLAMAGALGQPASTWGQVPASAPPDPPASGAISPFARSVQQAAAPAGAVPRGLPLEQRWERWPSSRPPRPGEAPSVKFPPYQTRTLANGLEVVVVMHHEQPAVSMRMVVKGGGAQDPQGLPGVANLVAMLLDQGTTTRSAKQIADEIDFTGGAVGAGAGTDFSYVGAVVLKSDFAAALDLFADVVRNPSFAPEELERQRQQVLSSFTVSYQDPGYVSSIVLDRLMFGFHPYGRPGTGTPDSVARISRGDLQKYHETWYAPNNAILAIVGDVTAEEAFAGAERVFGSWPRREIPRSDGGGVPPEPTSRVVVIDRPGSVQTAIRIGNIAIPRKHRDHTSFDLAVKILGGEGANRLQRVLRSERALTYGAKVDLQSLTWAGAVVAETETRTEATGEALKLAVEEFWRLQRETVGPGELADALAYLSGTFPLTIETPTDIAMQVLNVLLYDLDVRELETYRERIARVTPDDIQRTARSYLHPSRLSIVLVGDARRIVPQLHEAGFRRVEQIALEDLDLTAADLRRPAKAASAPASSGTTHGARASR